MEKHKYGKAYCHIPTGRKVLISRIYTQSYEVHSNFMNAFYARHDELRPWDYFSDERDAHQVSLGNVPPVTLNSFSNAVMFAVKNNGILLTPIHSI